MQKPTKTASEAISWEETWALEEKGHVSLGFNEHGELVPVLVKNYAELNKPALPNKNNEI
jgi:hypothetical protein